LYYSNQNQYFLHGLARAGEGLLAEDWLAQTLDPTPVFSALVALTARYLHPWLFYLYYALLQGAYAAALLALFVKMVGPDVARRWPVFAALLLAAHAALLRWCSYRWLGQDYPWFLQAGVAGQYVLGAVLQPSTFGVLLVVAVCLFAWGRVVLAVVCIAVAATVHSTYLLPGALLVAGFMTALVAEGRARQAIAVGALALLLVAPVSVYVLSTFGPTTAKAFSDSQGILVHIRIPHHCRVELWLDWVADLQLAWMAAGIALAGPRLRLALGVAAVLALGLTLVQVATKSNALALLFPWRISAVLMPVATAVLLARLVAMLPTLSESLSVRVGGLAVIVALAAAGVWIMAARLGFQSGSDQELLDHARRERQPGQVYFIPFRLLDVRRLPRGSLSSDFKPIADKRGDPAVIPPELQAFRLPTGVPIYVDFKSIPYKDVEVIEWYDRVLFSQKVQHQIAAGDGRAVDQLWAKGITHVLVPAGFTLRGAGVEKVFEDEHYRVYTITAQSKGD
jgi:hypothetical protein